MMLSPSIVRPFTSLLTIPVFFGAAARSTPFPLSEMTHINPPRMNLSMAVEVVSLFADAGLLALVRSAGCLGALAVNDAAYRGNVPVWLQVHSGECDATVKDVTPTNTMVPVGRSGNFDDRYVVHISARSCAHRAQPLPSAAVCTISHYNDLLEVQGPIRVLNARCITILDRCPAQVCIPGGFVEGCRRLESLAFATCNTHLSGKPPLSTVTTIQGGFLRGSVHLRRINLMPLANVAALQDEFLSGCRSLEDVDLSPLTNVTSVGADFMRGCAGLRRLDVSPLSKITAFRLGFLADCTSLEEVNLEAITGVTFVGEHFMSGCSGLRSLSLAPLSNITVVGGSFLKGCRSLEDVDLSPLSNVASVGGQFMSECVALRRLDVSPLSKITAFGRSFLAECTKLEEVSLEAITGVTRVGHHFMSGCTSIRVLGFSVPSQITTVGDMFLFGCTALEDVDFTGLSNVTSVGTKFMEGCVLFQNVPKLGMRTVAYM